MHADCAVNTVGSIRIVIADDQVLFVDTLRSVIENRAKDMEVLGVAYDGKDALEIIQKKRPDVAVVDIRMPKIDGVELTKRALESVPGVKMLILTAFPDDEYVQKAIKNGAAGYILKTTRVDELLSAVRAGVSGSFAVSHDVLGVLQGKPAYVRRTRLSRRVDPAYPAEATTAHPPLRPVRLPDERTVARHALGRGAGTRTVEGHPSE